MTTRAATLGSIGHRLSRRSARSQAQPPIVGGNHPPIANEGEQSSTVRTTVSIRGNTLEELAGPWRDRIRTLRPQRSHDLIPGDFHLAIELCHGSSLLPTILPAPIRVYKPHEWLSP